MGFPAGSKGGLWEGGEAVVEPRRLLRDYTAFLETGDETLAEKITGELAAAYARSGVLGVYANNSCNLKCTHCYYGFDRARDPQLKLDEWKRIIPEAYGEGFRRFAIVGKEPFISKRAIELFDLITDLRDRDSDVIVGAVNNGMFLKKREADLVRIKPDYIDVSVDGLEDKHDELRGAGAFKVVLENLGGIDLDAIARKVFISSVLHGRNSEELADIVPFFSGQGIRNFWINLIYNAHGDDLALSYEQLDEFVGQRLPEVLSGLRTPVHAMLSFDLSLVPDPGRFFAEYVEGHDLESDRYGTLYRDVNVGSSRVSYIFKLPQAYYEPYVAISSDGYAGNCIDFRGESTFSYPDYWNHATGNVREMSLRSIIDQHLLDVRHNLVSLRERMTATPSVFTNPLFLGVNQHLKSADVV